MDKLRIVGKCVNCGHNVPSKPHVSNGQAEIELERLHDDTPITSGDILFKAIKRNYDCNGSFNYKEIDLGVYAIATPVESVEEKKEELSLWPCQLCYFINKCGNGWFYNCRNNKFKHYHPQENKEPDICEQLRELKRNFKHSSLIDTLIAHFSKESQDKRS